MRRKTCFFGLSGLLLTIASMGAVPAHAIIVQVDYEARVTGIEGSGFGYSVGSLFAGQLFIDTDSVAGTENCGINPGFYDACDYLGGNLVLGGTSGGVGTDAVYVSDRLHSTCSGCENESESFFVSNGSYLDDSEGRRSSWSQSIRIFDAEIDFITGSALEQSFYLTRDQLSYYGNMYGSMSEWQRYLDTGNEIYSNSLNYDLTSIRVSTASVPEPGTLALMGIGLAGLIAARRRRSRSSS